MPGPQLSPSYTGPGEPQYQAKRRLRHPTFPFFHCAQERVASGPHLRPSCISFTERIGIGEAMEGPHYQMHGDAYTCTTLTFIHFFRQKPILHQTR